MPPLHLSLLLLRPLRRRFWRPTSHSIHSSSPSHLDLTHPTFTIWGSNTGIGKTLVSAGLAASFLLSPSSSSFLYLKPLQTGFPVDSDSRFVFRKVSDLFRRHHISSSSSSSPSFSLLASNHVIKSSPAASREVLGAAPEGSCFYEAAKLGAGEQKDEEVKEFKLVCKTLYAWNEPISPHLAAEKEEFMVDDTSLREALGKFLGSSSGEGDGWKGVSVWRVIETAGGVASPGPSGTLQCDLYRPFRLPAVLVGDGRLGGISSTISAYESLKLRGYDVAAVILEDHGLSNETALISYLKNRVPVLVLPRIPEDPLNNLMDWFDESGTAFSSLQNVMLSFHSERIHRLRSMQGKAKDILWWPFTQHDLVPEHVVTVIDSRCGENFSIHKATNGQGMISPQFDACASWWTQGPDSTLQAELAKDMGYSAARYGHVMFPENVYEPALHCAELLLEGVGKGWASRTFYSDNGSTSIEIALKMAFRKFSLDHRILVDCDKGILSERSVQLKVLALNGSYHGDTLGAMEAQAPSSYTTFVQQPWYSGRGIFLDSPTTFICNEIWNLSLPDSLQPYQLKPEDMRFSSLDEVFSLSRDSSDVAASYSAYISEQLSQYSALGCSTYVGALIIEPVVQGASGMRMIDPLFQRILVKECRNRRIPVIFDEVFTGFWRLGRESAAELLGCLPDVACYAKLMSGGIIPLAVTLTTEAVFEAFKGDSKLMALLHGHSYTAHAMGCTAAAKSIQWFRDPSTNHNLDSEGKKLKELWDVKLVHQISSLSNVQRVVALGTLFAVELKAEGSDVGYASLYASSLIQQLREDGVYMRPLGNVIYLMCGPCTSSDFCTQQLYKVYQRICDFNAGTVREIQSHENASESQTVVGS
ncbi:bifunctional dethiobiotin synthetase/7,8-diamino-pelargonic acid aminotransferase, mitochondrial [Typha angustifolia]|uniref:bifunctional dethiobiotin synthetase/7,8-diamino-pelargonic acid aminotransferase, mitochondrial n=1 Tax=Typha angustifolia TaxID=59011 RepID=UPI003C2D6753